MSNAAARDLASADPSSDAWRDGLPERGMDPEDAYRRIHDELRRDDPPGANLGSFVAPRMDPWAERLRAYGESERSRRGCLMVMTASEVSTRERAIARVVMSFMEEVRDLFAAALARAAAAGELPADAGVDQLADYRLAARRAREEGKA